MVRIGGVIRGFQHDRAGPEEQDLTRRRDESTVMTRQFPTEDPHASLAAFARAVTRPDDAIELSRAALLIARMEYPDLEVDAYLRQLDAMVDAARIRLAGAQDLRERLDALNDYLFVREGFRGNLADYCDPRNSFLNEVLDRRTGIPITLSLVYLEVGRRLGLSLSGAGMPGHFLVTCGGADAEIVLDPFGGGAILSPADCQRILDGLYGGRVAFEPRMLAPMGPRKILARILNNLKSIYIKQDQYRQAIAVVERLLVLHPDLPGELRDRGLLACQLKRYPAASADLDRYLRLSPEAEDRDVILEHLRSIRERVAALN